MKLIRFGEKRAERPGVLTEDGVRLDLSGFFADWDSEFLGEDGLTALREVLAQGHCKLPEVPEAMRWGAPIARPGKVVCIGLNYTDHALETGMPIPTEPIIFMKAANTVTGPFDDVEIPRFGEKTDWEIELGVVIGREARYLSSVADARDHIAGFCLSHDVSERHFQLERGGNGPRERVAIRSIRSDRSY